MPFWSPPQDIGLLEMCISLLLTIHALTMLLLTAFCGKKKEEPTKRTVNDSQQNRTQAPNKNKSTADAQEQPTKTPEGNGSKNSATTGASTPDAYARSTSENQSDDSDPSKVAGKKKKAPAKTSSSASAEQPSVESSVDSDVSQARVQGRRKANADGYKTGKDVMSDLSDNADYVENSYEENDDM